MTARRHLRTGSQRRRKNAIMRTIICRSFITATFGNFDDYLQKVNLANTDLGSKGQSLDLTKNRMANQQTTMEELKSTNEDRDLS